jgi:hypothetical protein
MKRMLQPMEGVVMMKMTTAVRRRRAMKKREQEMKDMEMRREERSNWERWMIRWIKTSTTCGTRLRGFQCSARRPTQRGSNNLVITMMRNKTGSVSILIVCFTYLLYSQLRLAPPDRTSHSTRSSTVPNPAISIAAAFDSQGHPSPTNPTTRPLITSFYLIAMCTCVCPHFSYRHLVRQHSGLYDSHICICYHHL